MARLPYASLTDPAVAPIAERVAAERGSVLHLYRMLLHSPPLAEGWLQYLTAVRQRCELPATLRELVIMRVAILNGARYEADQHAPIARQVGVREDQLEALADWSSSDAFEAHERLVLALTDAMMREVRVDAALLTALRERLPDRQLVELVATIAADNMVSRFLVALDVHSDDDASASAPACAAAPPAGPPPPPR